MGKEWGKVTMTAAPCPAGFLLKVTLTSGSCGKTFLLPLGQSTATDELLPASFSHVPLLATPPPHAGSQPP